MPEGVRTERRWRLMTLVAAAAVACAPSSLDRPLEAPNPREPAPRALLRADGSWVATHLPGVHSPLAATRDSIVYAGIDDGYMKVLALDPATGAQRWRHGTDLSARIPGVDLEILTDADTAYFLQSGWMAGWQSETTDPSRGLELVAVTTATGEIRWRAPLRGNAHPNARPCGDDACAFVVSRRGTELWRLDRRTGAVLATPKVGMPLPAGHDAILSDPLDRLLVASRGPVILRQYSATGESLDWSVAAEDAFPGVAVSPRGGWAAFRASDGGWAVWLGPDYVPLVPGSTLFLSAGKTLSRGSVAGLGPDGAPRWLARNRHFCSFSLSSPIPALCDGDARGIGGRGIEVRPHTAAGLDLTTGERTWALALDGAIDEWNLTEDVVLLNEQAMLLRLTSGTVRLDLYAGPVEGEAIDLTGWCVPDSSRGDKVRSSPWLRYKRADHPFPCRMGAIREAQPAATPIPAFAGVNVAGWSAWVEDGHVHALRQP